MFQVAIRMGGIVGPDAVRVGYSAHVAELETLRRIMRQLRDPEGGCPWDLEQDFESIAPYTIEEAYEVEDAIRRQDFEELRGELGDLLLQVVYHSQLAEEAGHFELSGVVEGICDKLVARHPHVFGDVAHPLDRAGVTDRWEERKASERSARGAESALDHIPRALPALMRAAKLAARAQHAKLGPDPEAALWAKMEEGLGSLGAPELGRLLALSARQAARMGLDPEALVRDENARFEAVVRQRERLQAEGGRSEEIERRTQSGGPLRGRSGR